MSKSVGESLMLMICTLFARETKRSNKVKEKNAIIPSGIALNAHSVEDGLAARDLFQNTHTQYHDEQANRDDDEQRK